MYRAYFHRIERIGFEKIPVNTPVIFISNHTNGLMDAIIPAALHRRSVWFWGRIEEFPDNLKGKFMRTMHGLPIYRRQNGLELMKRNNTTFDQSKEKLDEGDTIFLAPEGTCVIHRKLLPFKTGCARFSFDYAFENEVNNPLLIVPIAVTYTSWNQVKSSVMVEVMDPVDVCTYRKAFEEDEEIAVRSLTRELREKMKEGMIYVEHETHEDTILDFIDILIREFESNQGGYTTQKSIHQKVKHIAKDVMTWPTDRLASLRGSILAYQNAMSEAGLKDIKLARLERGYSRHFMFLLGIC